MTPQQLNQANIQDAERGLYYLTLLSYEHGGLLAGCSVIQHTLESILNRAKLHKETSNASTK